MTKITSENPNPGITIEGEATHLHVWAPNAKAVALLTDFNDWEEVESTVEESENEFWSDSTDQLGMDD